MKKKLFISYAHEDSDVLEALESHLNSVSKRESYHNFLDVFIDKRKIRSGFRWDSVIEESLESADGYVFLVSRHAMESEFIRNQELPGMAFRHTRNNCPIYIFRVSAYSYGDEAIPLEGSGESITLGTLQHIGPWLNEEQTWYRSLEPGVAEEALMKAATEICDGMFELMQQETAAEEQGQVSEQTPAGGEKVKVPRKTSKPVLDNYLAFIDRTDVINPLEAQVSGNLMVAVSATGTVTDWFEGLAMRLCFDRVPGTATGGGTSPATSARPVEYRIFKINWPDQANETSVRESALWMPLLQNNGISPSTDPARNMDALWTRFSRSLNGGRRVVVHYFISTKNSDLKKDLELAERLALQWERFFEKVEKQMPGRMLLLFSINDDFEGETGFWPWGSKPLSADRLMDRIGSVLGKSLGNTDSEPGCCALQGGRLKKIEFPDIDINWRESLKATGFDDNDIATFIAAVENKIPVEGIALYELRRELKQDSEIKKLFKIT